MILAKCSKLEIVTIITHKFVPDANFLPELFSTFPKMSYAIVALIDDKKQAARYQFRGNWKLINEIKMARNAGEVK